MLPELFVEDIQLGDGLEQQGRDGCGLGNGGGSFIGVDPLSPFFC
jgi:hypothetical protein